MPPGQARRQARHNTETPPGQMQAVREGASQRTGGADAGQQAGALSPKRGGQAEPEQAGPEQTGSEQVEPVCRRCRE